MFVDGCEGGDEVVCWELDDRDVPTRGDSAVNAIFQMTVPEDRQFYLARATYTFSERKVVLCGDDDRKSSGRVEASIEASRKNDGSSEGRASISIEHKTDDGCRFKAEAGGNVKQDKDGNVQTGGYTSMSLGVEY